MVPHDNHTKSMDTVKNIITGPQCLAHFDPKLQTILLTAASRTGLGYILIQTELTETDRTRNKGATGHITKDPRGKLITCGSRFLSSAENNYAVIELELLAIQWAVSKCRIFGRHRL